MARVQVQDLRAHRVEEGAVVAGDDGDAGQRADEVLEEGRTRVVQVVRRLVEQHAPRTPGDQSREGQPAALAAGQLGHRAVGVDRGQPEPGRRHLGAALGVPGLAQGGPGEQLVVLVGAPGLVQPGGQVLQPSHGQVQRRQRGLQDLGHGRAVRDVRLLREEGQVPGTGHRSGIEALRPGEHPEQRGLPGTVPSDETQRAAGPGENVDPIEDDPVGVGHDDVARDQGSQGGQDMRRSRQETTPIASGGRDGVSSS